MRLPGAVVVARCFIAPARRAEACCRGETIGAKVDVEGFLEAVKASPDYAGQVVYVGEAPARPARFRDPAHPLPRPVARMLKSRGIERLYSHQAEALDHVGEGADLLVVTGTASGKSLCYLIPIIEMLLADPDDTALLLFPTKALCQDQFRGFAAALQAAGIGETLAGVYDGDTPAPARRRLRDHASAIFTNPDMVHAALMPQHARWSRFLARLKLLVIDELHVYSGIFGSNAANLLKRFFRVCRHYGSHPQIVSCSATVGNPLELAEGLTGRKMALVDDDGSPRGKRTYVFWNPPPFRGTTYRSRRSANVEAHELMAALVQRGVPTITFSKAKMTAEMIHRYVSERLSQAAPGLADKVSPYRGGYLPAERREIERRLFSGELLGVSTTRALELGIDVGGLDASILVGYPGTLASFFQQSGRAGRTREDSLVILIGLDTSVNQYVMSHPDYLFQRPIEQAVIDPANPYVITNHLRCAAHEMPVEQSETQDFGPYSQLALEVLQQNRKVSRIGDQWYHAATETPQHEVSLRHYADRNVLIQDVDTGKVLGQVNKFDAPPILHPEAIYMHLGDTYRVLSLDLDRNLALVKRVEVDYYTQPLGGTDVHHVDHRLREKPFGAGLAHWGEVTAYFRCGAYEKVHFYSLDAISEHPLDLPTFALETMAVWIVPPEQHLVEVRRAGLDAHSGLRAIGYAARTLLPLFMTCDTLDFSHSIGSVNSEWHAIFIYERCPHGLGFTEKAYERLHDIMPAVLDNIRSCPCAQGCPCCVGKPLRQYATWNVERGEASIPSKASALMILENLLGDGSSLRNPDSQEPTADAGVRMEQSLRRRLERTREPQVFHPIEPKVSLGYPEPESGEALSRPDPARRAERRRAFDKELRKRIAKRLPERALDPLAQAQGQPEGMKKRPTNLPSTHFPGRPSQAAAANDGGERPTQEIRHGDALAAKARRLKRRRENPEERPGR